MNQERPGLEPNGERMAWILGSSRSGSSWLLAMLAELPGIVPVDDPHLGHHLSPWRPIPLAWATAAEEPELRTLRDVKRHRDDYFFSDRYREAWLPALRELVRRRVEAQMRDAELPARADPMVVIKEPGSQAAELILELFPQSRLIFLLRDGRDVVDSWLGAYSAGSWAIAEGAYPVSDAGRIPFIRWQAAVWVQRTEAVQRAFERHPAPNRVMVRYEDLLRSPTRELGRISALIGNGAGRALLARTAEVHSFGRVPPGARGNGRPARSAAPGSWRKNLTPEERAAMHEVMGPKLRELGYRVAGRDTAALVRRRGQRPRLAA